MVSSGGGCIAGGHAEEITCSHLSQIPRSLEVKKMKGSKCTKMQQ